MGQGPLKWTEIGPEWFELSLRYFATTGFDAGKLKPNYFFKKIIPFTKIQNVHQEALAPNTPFFCHTIWFYVTESRNLSLHQAISHVGVTQSLFEWWNLSSSHATSHQVTQPLLKSRKPPQVTQPLIKSSNPPHQLISIIPLQMLSSFSFSSHLALSKYFPSTNKVKHKTTKREIQTTFPGRGKMWLSKGREGGEWGRSTGPPLSRERVLKSYCAPILSLIDLYGH